MSPRKAIPATLFWVTNSVEKLIAASIYLPQPLLEHVVVA